MRPLLIRIACSVSARFDNCALVAIRWSLFAYAIRYSLYALIRMALMRPLLMRIAYSE